MTLVLASMAVLAGEKNTQVIDDAAYLKPQQLVAVDEARRMNIYCTGSGSPTVVFDSGLGGEMMDWALVQPRIAAETRACSYDRAGLGFSDPSPSPRTSAHVVDDLHRLPRAARVEPPNTGRFGDAINALRIRRATQSGYMASWLSEQENVWSVSADQLRAAHRGLGDLPIIVLTHELLPRRDNETQEMRDAQNRIRTELHAEIAAMSTRGSVRMVRNSGHYFQLDQPEEVSAAVLDVVRGASATAKPR